jgi:hypothetical protein
MALAPRMEASPLRASDPATGGEVINYTADQIIEPASRALYISAAGTLKVDMVDGHTLTFEGLVAGTLYPIAIKKIYMTGSSNAAGLILR